MSLCQPFPRRVVTTIALSASLLAGLVLSGCADMEPLATEDQAVTIPVINAPRAVRWEDLDRGTQLWSRHVKHGVVILGPSTTLRRFVAYGVDAERDHLRWVLDIAIRDYQSFIAFEGDDWTANVGFDNDANHAIAGSVQGGGPRPPQPGEPPFARTVAAVTNAARDIDQAIEVGKDVLGY